MEKEKGILIKWNDAAGYGFVLIGRNPDGTRVTRFLHIKNVERIECENGIPEVGCEVRFNERDDPRGTLAVNAEILAIKPRVHRNEALKMLAGGGQ